MKQLKIDKTFQPFGLSITDDTRAGCSGGVRRYPIRTRAGAALGDLYGLVLHVSPSEALSFEDGALVVEGDIADPEAFEAGVLCEILGSFAVLTHGQLPRRLYPDCGSSLPIVYCARSRRAASSAGMLFGEDEYAARFLEERYRRLVATGGAECWISGTLTAHEGVARLLPNHYLDLETWKAARFWPRRGDFAQDMSPSAAARTVAGRLEAFFVAAAAEHRVGLALTAGYDSRILLAAARAAGVEIEAFTLAPERRGIDQVMAGAAAAALGIPHRLMAVTKASQAEREGWDRAVGHAICHANRVAHPTLRQLDHTLIVSGILGETGRSRLYQRDLATINDLTLTPAALLARIGQPRDPELLADMEAWLAEVAWLPASAILDLAVLELFYMPIWRPAQCGVKPEMMPLVDRVIQTAFLSVPPQEKGTEALFRACIAQLWPAALELPVNSYGDWRDWQRKAARLGKLLDRGRLVRYVRDRLDARLHL